MKKPAKKLAKAPAKTSAKTPAAPVVAQAPAPAGVPAGVSASVPAPASPAAPRRAAEPDAAPLLALIDRIVQKDQQALADLYDHASGRVYGLALRIARSEALAEEIAGDVFLQVWKTAASYSQERGHPMAWLMVITRSRALDALRRVDQAQTHPEPETLAEAQDGGDDPQNLLDALQEGSALHAAIAGLPAVQRQLLALAFFQGMTHSEIAAHVVMPLGTVKTHVRRALQALRGALE